MYLIFFILENINCKRYEIFYDIILYYYCIYKFSNKLFSFFIYYILYYISLSLMLELLNCCIIFGVVVY